MTNPTRKRVLLTGLSRAALRRVTGLLTGVVAAAALLVPIAAANEPAAAWVPIPAGSARCASLPSAPSSSFYLVAGGVAQAYREPLTRAAAAWDSWSGVTGISVKVVETDANVPAGGLPVAVVVTAQGKNPDSLAQALQVCNPSGVINGGILRIYTSTLGPKSAVLKQYAMAHELGHIFGLHHNEDQPTCGTVMYKSASEGTICRDNGAPYVDDVAGVVAIWRPQQTPGFPAESRIAGTQAAKYLASSYARNAGRWNALSFADADPAGYSEWTFVPDKARNGWGWVVNTASGMCLAYDPVEQDEFIGAHTVYMRSCDHDEARWLPAPTRDGKTQLLNKVSRGCLGAFSGNASAFASLRCQYPETRLTIQKSTVTRVKRSLPDVIAPGDAIIGAQSQRCITVTGGSRQVGAGLSLRGCDGSAEQNWVFHPVSGGYALSVYGQETPDVVGEDRESAERCAATSGATVLLQACDASAAQIWTMNTNGTIRNQATGTCLNVSNEGTADGSPVISYACGTAANMVWSVPTLLRAQSVSLAPVSSTAGGVLSTAAAPSGDADRRTRSVLTRNPATDRARWGFLEVPGTNGGGLLKNLDTGHCLRWRGNGAQAALDQACDGADSSYRWGPTVNARGEWKLQSQYTGECLDLWGGSDGEGAVIGTYGCNNASNQWWRPVLNDGPPPAPWDAPTVGGNRAMLGTATQSSTYGPRWTAERAIDGSADESLAAETLTHTQSEQYPWWQVDLGESTPIGSVTVYNRTDCCAERSTDVWVLASNTPFPATGSPQSIAATPGVVSTHSTTNTGPALGWSPAGSYRYVRVQLGTTNPLSLREVTILP